MAMCAHMLLKADLYREYDIGTQRKKMATKVEG